MKKIKVSMIAIAVVICLMFSSCLTMLTATLSPTETSGKTYKTELFSWAKDELGSDYTKLSSFTRTGENTVIVSGGTVTLKGDSLFLSRSLSIWFELAHAKSGNSFYTSLKLRYDYEVAHTQSSSSIPGLTGTPSYLLLSCEETRDSVLLSFDSTSNTCQVTNELQEFVLTCPDYAHINIFFYDKNGNRLYARGSKFVMSGSASGYYTFETDYNYCHTINTTSLKALFRAYLILNSFGNHAVNPDKLNGFVAYSLKTPEIYANFEQSGLCIIGKTLGLRYKTFLSANNVLGIGFDSQPAYLLLSNAKMTDVVVLSVDKSGFIPVGEELIRYLQKCPKNSTISIEYYDGNGYRINRRYRYFDSSKQYRLETEYYSETMKVSTALAMVDLYNEIIGRNVSERIYADTSSGFYINKSYKLCLEYETHSNSPLGYGLRYEPRYLILRSSRTNESIILDVGNEGTYIANLNLVQFIYSCPDGDTIHIEYYDASEYRITYNKRTYDSNGNGSKTSDSEWYSTIDVTAAKKLIKQWQTLNDFDYLSNWEIDKEATVNWILGI